MFDQYRVDVTAPDAAERLAAALAGDGLATFEDIHGRSQTLALACRLLRVVPHRDASPDGVTFIADRGEVAHQTGYAGFGAGELYPHTESSALPRPPEVLMLTCARSGSVGGECLIVDGRAVHADLAAHQPDLLAAFTQPSSVHYGTGPGHLASVFEPIEGTRVSLRLRLDDLGRFPPQLSQRLPELRAAIDRHTWTLPLAAGQGYLLHNHRMLHGRRAFAGGRVMYRVLGDLLPAYAIPSGFAPTPAGLHPTLP